MLQHSNRVRIPARPTRPTTCWERLLVQNLYIHQYQIKKCYPWSYNFQVEFEDVTSIDSWVSGVSGVSGEMGGLEPSGSSSFFGAQRIRHLFWNRHGAHTFQGIAVEFRAPLLVFFFFFSAASRIDKLWCAASFR